MDLNRRRVNRRVYNFIDFLGDIGGLNEAILLILTSVVFVFEVNALENFLVSKLMKERVKGKDEASWDAKELEFNKLSRWDEFIYGFLL